MRINEAIRHIQSGEGRWLLGVNPDYGSRIIFFAAAEDYSGGALVGIDTKAASPGMWAVFNPYRDDSGSLITHYPHQPYFLGFVQTDDSKAKALIIAEEYINSFENLPQEHRLSEAEFQLMYAATKSHQVHVRLAYAERLRLASDHEAFEDEIVSIIERSELPRDIQQGLKECFNETDEVDNHIDEAISALTKIRDFRAAQLKYKAEEDQT